MDSYTPLKFSAACIIVDTLSHLYPKYKRTRASFRTIIRHSFAAQAIQRVYRKRLRIRKAFRTILKQSFAAQILQRNARIYIKARQEARDLADQIAIRSSPSRILPRRSPRFTPEHVGRVVTTPVMFDTSFSHTMRP